GAIGTSTFVWPAPSTSVSGFGYSSYHPAIDIGGAIGNAIYASDTGVVVYAGWNDYGYGNLIILDHGTGWQTLYAHLDTVKVGCGESVFQSSLIGTMGVTGNSSGPHLHFEMQSDTYG
ncbi:MAG: peptidoglycan DD-metalloendopeptidase family protein, partial [Anaerolineae bacterium]|nr:peptidoglycan DD-metalloendopeptidase family protein [Anaerolineae bacterium]